MSQSRMFIRSRRTLGAGVVAISTGASVVLSGGVAYAVQAGEFCSPIGSTAVSPSGVYLACEPYRGKEGRWVATSPPTAPPTTPPTPPPPTDPIVSDPVHILSVKVSSVILHGSDGCFNIPVTATWNVADGYWADTMTTKVGKDDLDLSPAEAVDNPVVVKSNWYYCDAVDSTGSFTLGEPFHVSGIDPLLDDFTTTVSFPVTFKVKYASHLDIAVNGQHRVFVQATHGDIVGTTTFDPPVTIQEKTSSGSWKSVGHLRLHDGIGNIRFVTSVKHWYRAVAAESSHALGTISKPVHQ